MEKRADNENGEKKWMREWVRVHGGDMDGSDESGIIAIIDVIVVAMNQ
jgi:hypothetical protein